MAKPIKRGHMWYSDYREGDRRIRRPLSRDKREAQAMLDELMAMRRAAKWGGYVPNMSWKLFRERYLEYSRLNKKHKTFQIERGYIGVFERAMYPKRLGDITPEVLQRFKDHLISKGTTDWTAKSCVGVIKTAMHKAEEWKFVHAQNWKTVRFKKLKGRLHFFRIEELKRIVACAPGLWRTAILLLGKAGLRRGEALTLEWKDVDALNNRILIRAKELPNGTIWEPKKGKERMIPIDAELKADLEARRKAKGFVLEGINKDENEFLKSIKQIVKSVGLSGTPHTFRHTFASHLAMAGVPLIEIMELMGHSSIDMVLIYAHLCPESQEAAIKKLPVLLGSTVGSKSVHEVH